jgi:asparagine synthase (glutamine-hydrolysing)
MYDPQAESCRLLRDPSANLACYHAKWDAIHIFFSELEDLKRYVPISLSIDWRHIAARLLIGPTLSTACALNEIDDIPGGQLMTISKRAEQRTLLWSPHHLCCEDAFEDERKSAAELRAAVFCVVHAFASEHDNIAVLLSGGLDSSIVASCLSQQTSRQNVTCINFYITGNSAAPAKDQSFPGLSGENLAKVRRVIGNADEREFAQKVARKCGFPLVERERTVFTLDFQRLYDAPLAPRPSGYAFLQDEDDIECALAATTRSTACFTGQGGDSVFYATSLAVGAIDYAYLHPFGTRLIREIASAVNLSRESFAHVLQKVIKHGYLRLPLPPTFDPRALPHLLKDEVQTSVPDDYFHHPWIDVKSSLCPGKHRHVLGIATSVPGYDNVYHRERIAPSVHPLAAQPVVEACLRTPTYALLTGGISRGLARCAFEDILPPEVFRRTVKGTGTALYQNSVRRNMEGIAEHLLDGVLVQKKLLDHDKLEAYLVDGQPFLTVQPVQILDYLACEAWATQLR